MLIPQKGQITVELSNRESYNLKEINLDQWRVNNVAYVTHDTLVEEGSTGQKQLTNINNILATKQGANIFLFDEADNALDETNKEDFQNKLKELVLQWIEYLIAVQMVGVLNGETDKNLTFPHDNPPQTNSIPDKQNSNFPLAITIIITAVIMVVGKNCYVLEKNNDLIIVDCGIKFLNGSNLADGTIPNFSYLVENRKKIKGLFITHGHEDHIGGISYLLQLIPTIPVYGSEFSISLLKQKLRGESKEKTTIFQDDTVINTGEFRLKFFRVTHSIPGSFGIIIEIGEKTDLFKLMEYGKKGVDLLLSDSTNAEVEGTTPSETKVIEIAQKTQKKIVLLGSSLLKMMKAIQKASLWKIDSSIFLKAVAISKTPNNKLIIFCTGSQGEERAVLSRLAHQNYPDWKVAAGDSIILTSSPIMDNKSQVEIINNKLFTLGAKIYENNKEDLLHASGHACQEDLKLMLKLVNPSYFMPFHGNFRMLKKHGHLAQELGLPKENILVCQNGEVVEGQDKKFFLSKTQLSVQPNYVLDGKLLPKEEINHNLSLRTKMSQGGVILIVIFYNRKKAKITEPPYIFTYGFINMQKSKNLTDSWKKKINDYIENNNSKKD
ncbi:10666_t:CDS:2 [Entrophospora sp. SA101]|nr:10666_t:CDS:2 [Entrophospora sp. SA101]